MFAVFCFSCRKDRLLGPRRLVAIDVADGGLVAVLRCFCESLVHSTLRQPEVHEEEAA